MRSLNKLLPSLLPNQLIILLTCEEHLSRQEIAPLDPFPVGSENQM